MERFVARAQDIVRVQRLLPLVLGYYAYQDLPARRYAKEVGSGIFVSKRLALTARHVSESQYRLDSGWEALQRSRPVIPVRSGRSSSKTSDYASFAFQAKNRGEAPAPDEGILWNVRVDWASRDTEISALCLEPRTYVAAVTEAEQDYLTWQLLPPPVGATVVVCGFPNPSIEVGGPQHELNLDFEYRLARVEERFYPMRDHGFCSFPAFRLDRAFDHGMSGAPVLLNDTLVGIFSGPDLVAALWPLTLLAFSGIDGTRHVFSDYFDREVIHARDWGEVKGHVARVSCDEVGGTSSMKGCRSKHVILRT